MAVFLIFTFNLLCFLLPVTTFSFFIHERHPHNKNDQLQLVGLEAVNNHPLNVTLEFSESSLQLEIGSHDNISIKQSGKLENATTVIFTYDIGGKDYFYPPKQLINMIDNITLYENETNVFLLTIKGLDVGNVILGMKSNSTEIKHLNESYVIISVIHSYPLHIFSEIIGWIYFVGWSISFYPQIYLNFKRRSVVGLNFDFLTLNFIGFFCYSLFNCGLFFIHSVKEEYHELHPRGIIPVEINDVVFALHALLLTMFTIGQCFFLKRNKQRVSRICMMIVGGIGIATIIMIGVLLGHKVNTLDLLYYFSYVKLGITIIKYIPQAWFNFKRKSTVGWSIGNILLDFTGGFLSIIQMFIVAYNNDDWSSLFGNPTKFGLGLFSVLFDILFMVQHYCLYRRPPGYKEIIGTNEDERAISPEDRQVNEPFVNSNSIR